MLLESLTKRPFQVHFVWQVWDGQLSPAFKYIRLKAFGGWNVDRGTTELHARILRGKGVQKKKPNKFTVGSSTSATFVLPVRHGTGVALQRKRMDISQNPQSATGTLARGHGKALKPEDTDVMWMIDQAQERAASSNGLDNSH